MLRRRHVLRSASAAVAGVLTGFAKPALAVDLTSGSGKVPFRWRVPEPFADKAQNDLPYEGTAEEEDSRGLIVIIAGVVALVYLARNILRMHDELEGGTVIDLRGPEILIERNRSLPGEKILIVGAKDRELIDRSNVSNADDLVAVIKAIK